MGHMEMPINIVTIMLMLICGEKRGRGASFLEWWKSKILSYTHTQIILYFPQTQKYIILHALGVNFFDKQDCFSFNFLRLKEWLIIFLEETAVQSKHVSESVKPAAFVLPESGLSQ